jgi:predicted GNAT family N-acyltransferase
MSRQVDIVRIVGGSLHATNFSASLYDSGIELRQRCLWAVDGCSVDDYSETDRHAIHFFATTTIYDERDGEIDTVIGTVQYDPDMNQLRQLIVDESYRSQNVGSRLVDAVKEEANGRYEQEYLKVHAWLDSALFYAKNGFVAEGDVYKSNGVLRQVLIYRLPKH